MRAFKRLVLSYLSLVASLPALAAPDLQAPDDIRGLLTPYLPESGGSPRRLQEELGEILATEGYFSPQFEFSGEDDALVLRLDPGPRTLIGEVDIRIDGPVDEQRRTASSPAGSCRSAGPSARKTGARPSSRCWANFWPTNIRPRAWPTARPKSTPKPGAPVSAHITKPVRATASGNSA